MMHDNNQLRFGSITTSEKELKDIIKAWLAISVAFGILLTGSTSLSLYTNFILASLTVGIGFLFHELAHKIVAQRYGCFAEFRSFDQLLMLAIIMSFFGFIFAAPGAVMISGPVGIRRNGKISVAGPVTNIILSLFFLILILAIPMSGFLALVARYGFIINSWLALFNMIPIWQLDGAKVLKWNKPIYGLVVAIAVILMAFQNFI